MSTSNPGVERLGRALEAADLGALDHDLVVGDVFLSPRGKELFGLGPEAGCSFEDLAARVHPDDRLAFREITERADNGDGTYAVEYRVVLADGAERWLEDRGRISFEGEGVDRHAVHRAGVLKKVADPRREPPRTTFPAIAWEATAAFLNDGLAFYTPDGRLCFVNGAGRRILGLEPGRMDAVGFETAGGQPLAVDQTPEARALRGETVRDLALVVPGPKDTCAFVSATAMPVTGTRGETIGAVVIFTDETPWRRLLEQQERLVRTLSHDLRTPLSTIQLQANMIERTGANNETTARRLRAILTSVHRLNGMIQDVVDVSRLETGTLVLKRVAVELAPFFTDLLDRLAKTMDVARIRRKILPDIPAALADPLRLERIVVSLLSNALKYSPPASEVVLSAETAEGGVLISVLDHGHGIPSDALLHLFERGRSRTLRSDGPGLGLYVASLLVKAHDGTLRVHSEVGHGSVFEVALRSATP